MIIHLHYGPDRADGLVQRGLPCDHPFGRLMPDEVIEKIDAWVTTNKILDVVLVEELPMTYLRYLIRKGTLAPDQVHIWWHDDEVRKLRLGQEGELLDPWPTGFFDRSLEFVLGAWGDR